MSYKVKAKGPCVECGNITNKKRRKDRQYRCQPCGERAMIRSAVEMRMMRGEAAATWFAGIERAMAKHRFWDAPTSALPIIRQRQSIEDSEQDH